MVQLFSCVFIALMLFGWSFISCVYVQSFFFKDASAASSLLTNINAVLGTPSLFELFSANWQHLKINMMKYEL